MLSVESSQIPAPQPGELLIEVHYAGVLPLDCAIRSGFAQAFFPVEFPYVPGFAVSGVVAQLGPDVTGFKVGQFVFGNVKGAYSEYAIGKETEIFPMSENLGFKEAAMIPGGGASAWKALFHIGNLQEDQKVLITGAAGGVGQFAVQLAKNRGAYVLATASPSNISFVESLGADLVFDYTKVKLNELKEKVDLVIDNVGGEVQNQAWSILKKSGKLVSLVQPPSEEQAALIGVTGAFVMGVPHRKDFIALANLMASGVIKTEAPNVFDLDSVRQAHTKSELRHGRGRVLLKIK
ncbi:NADPH:quinone reductase [Paenibacillus nasutitermitis]|uniref:NADPH:quinone reductase n=1 Tax=Paenibacillus nasutitermitis TaxID=1652958 RepID=A0A917DQ73_9BACL|nr:NADPH:quinone reductase [Paenibacillus nasutitermitis]